MNADLPELDIIIPTHNSVGTIELTLRALFTQHHEVSSPVRIIISDDGSSDRTLAIVETLRRASPWPFLVLHREHKGAAAARNYALAHSEAPLLLILGADIILRPGALAAHLTFHDQHPDPYAAALGYVAWDPRVLPSPFMEWMVHGGPQNNFDVLLGQETADASHFMYGSHLSLKRSLLMSERWSEEFGNYGWEDIELGRRLAPKGLSLHPLFMARGLHHHYYTTRDIVRRQRAAGRTLGVYQRLHPGVPLLPPRTRRAVWKSRIVQWSGVAFLLQTLLTYTGKRWSTPRLFSYLTTVEYWEGILTAQRR